MALSHLPFQRANAKIDNVASRSYFAHMRAVGLKILKNRLSEYVRMAANGETILVTDRDRVVAELGPPSPMRSSNVADERMAELIRKGIFTPAKIKGGEVPRKPVMSFEEMMKELDEVRRDRFE